MMAMASTGHRQIKYVVEMCQKTAQALGGRRGERRETMRGVCCETRTVCTTAADARPTELGTNYLSHYV